MVECAKVEGEPGLMSDKIFQVTDLKSDRTAVMDAARSGGATIRDTDGRSIAMLPAAKLDVYRNFAEWSQRLERLTEAARTGNPTVGALGDLAWARVFDADDLAEFAEEVHTVLMAALADEDFALLEEVVGDWRTTARQLSDPLRASVLRSSESFAESDYVEIDGPPHE